MSEQNKVSPVVLLILDGWGMAPPSPANAITTANTPQWDSWCQDGTLIPLEASGHHVGLPDNQMGNSEVGHMHIGAGRIIPQDLSKINHAICDKSFYLNKNLLDAIANTKKNKGQVHLIGLVSDGGVHAHEAHLYALLDLLEQQQVSDAKIHCITDGRDTAPFDAIHAIARLQQRLHNRSVASIASLMGRFYAMDRDNRWDRIEKAYNLLTQAQQETNSPEMIIGKAYDNEVSDEFISPQACPNHTPIADDDLLICFNYRSDRMREITYSLTDKNFTHFKRSAQPKCQVLTMTPYASNMDASVIFPKKNVTHTLGECAANASLKQLRIAETEKYAHVTFFFNGGEEQPFQQEDRKLIASPQVETYDLKPEMSAQEVTSCIIEALSSKQYDLIICNYANADMVGHTGHFEATIKAIETLDNCFKQIESQRQKTPFELVITADHGNAEQMLCDTGSVKHTAHTSSVVPLLHIGQSSHAIKDTGTLIDIAPTLLYLLQLNKPQEMTGEVLLTLDRD